jgi:hypothetical protein
MAEPAAAQPARAGEQQPSTAVPELALDGKCGRTVKAHLRARRGEHNLELVAALLYQSCEDGKWDPQRHACVASANSMEAVVSCRAEAMEREIKRDVGDGAIAKSGIPACDRYYAELIACMVKVNPQHAGQMRKSFHRAAVMSRDMARSASQKAIADGCRRAHEHSADSYKHCKWSVP